MPQRALSMAAAFFMTAGVHAGEGLHLTASVSLRPRERAQQGGAALLSAGELPGRQSKGLAIQS